jgi:hypothetical protein
MHGFNAHYILWELDNDTGGIGELEFFGNPSFELL